MQLVEFETTAHQHTIRVPDTIPDGARLRVLLLLNDTPSETLPDKKAHQARYHDLDDLFGAWSAEDYERIQGIVTEQRKIDHELWT